MDVVVIALVAAAAGYAFRGLVAKEIKAAGAELKVVLADLKAEVAKLEAAVKAKL